MTRPPSVLCSGLWSLAQGFGCGDCFSPCLLTKPLILHSASGLPPNLIPTPVPVITGSLGCAGGPHADGEGWVSVGTVFRDGLWWRSSARCRPRGPCGFGDAWAGSGLTRSPVRGHVGEMPGNGCSAGLSRSFQDADLRSRPRRQSTAVNGCGFSLPKRCRHVRTGVPGSPTWPTAWATRC